eukprot:6200579-Pleurochrysis_carterae.AAC.1
MQYFRFQPNIQLISASLACLSPWATTTTLPNVCSASHGTARKGFRFVPRFTPQFEAAPHTIQEKDASLYDHLSGTDPGASPSADPHPGAAWAGTQSQATTPAED